MSWPEAIATWTVCILWGVHAGLKNWSSWHTTIGVLAICAASLIFTSLT